MDTIFFLISKIAWLFLSPDSLLLILILVSLFLLYRGKKSFIILNKFPYNNGHVMVVPNQHTGDLYNLNQDEQLDLFALITLSTKVLTKVMKPHGFNIGMNLGLVAGAGIEDHVHFHIVPRWNGDTNFMPVISNTKVISEALEKSYAKLNKAIQMILKGNDEH